MVSLLTVVATQVGCELTSPAKSAASLTYTEDAHAAYKEALAAFDDKNWIDARALFSEVRRLFSFSRYARLAELRIADIDFQQGKYKEAISGYKAFVRGHRGDPNIEYARFRTSKALFLDISDTPLLPPQEERDQASTEDAYRELKEFHNKYPRSRHRVEADYLFDVVRQRLVRHELYVARYYLNQDNFDATLARIDYAVKKYLDSGLEAEALVLKGETLLKMARDEDARKVFEDVIADYGGPFGRVAKRFLATMAPAPGSAAPDPTVADPTVADPTVADPTVADPTVADPTVPPPGQ